MRIDSLKKDFDNFLRDIKSLHIPKGMIYNLYADEHFIERMDERNITNKQFALVVSKLMKYKLCEVLYFSHSEHKQIYIHDGDLVCICLVRPTYLVFKTTYISEQLEHITDPLIDLNDVKYKW